MSKTLSLVILALAPLMPAQTPEHHKVVMSLPQSASAVPNQTLQPQTSSVSLPQEAPIPRPHGIGYTGGPIMVETKPYLIWYGDWSNNTAPAIVNDFAAHIGGSLYGNIARSYYDSGNNRNSNVVLPSVNYYDSGSRGFSSLVDYDFYLIVMNAIRSGKVGKADPNGIYFVMTAPGVGVNGYGTSFCGWHNWLNKYDFPELGNLTLKVSFIGPGGGGCTVQSDKSPNNNPGADASLTIWAHEYHETVSDPELNAWIDFTGDPPEDADKCAWNMGPEQTAWNGSKYNLQLGDREYLIQQIWANDGPGYCTMQWPAPISATGKFYIISKNGSKCLTATGTASQRGMPVNQDTCYDGPEQTWMFKLVNGGYEITNQGNGQQLDVRGGPGATANGVPIQTWPFWGGSNELFGFSDPNHSGGYSDFTAFNSARVLDVWGASKLDNIPIQQYDFLNGPNQNWRLVSAQQ